MKTGSTQKDVGQISNIFYIFLGEYLKKITFSMGNMKMSLNYTIFWHAQNQKNTIISNIESFHFFLSMFWFKILNFDTFLCFLTPF